MSNDDPAVTRVMIVPAGGEWLWSPMPLDDAAGAITAAVGHDYRALALTDQLTVLVGERDDPGIDVNPYLPAIGRLYGRPLTGRGSAVFTGGLVRVGQDLRVMPLSAAHCRRLVDVVDATQSRMLAIRPRRIDHPAG
ncbi:hypothetical protein [Nakamurella multipartita]|uniref:Uncharacterized protein n=1 Tax=Nakamurella multipartita (strain ATCC 700099 / DSM 44233 / CIP 104796 / JCM 9543 / NBRC 105858 / Y-104) TaxID=479431 RepID=C8X8G5_NAKMY|nr:hypothetical protein [Nakamurella multipartita]ACV79020.1 hypothetical protein Namu_2674 [Nakamurella multipartita DSM 44233]